MSRFTKSVLLLLSVLMALGALASCSPAATPTPVTIIKEVEKEKVVVVTATPLPVVDLTPVYDFDPTVKPAKKYKIAVVLKNFTNPFWLTHQRWALKAGEDFGVEVTVLAPSNPDNVEEQIRIVEDLITKGVDGVVIAPANTTAIATAIQKLNAAKIPVIYDNTRGSGGDYVCYIGADNILVGKTVAEGAVQAIGEKGRILILEGFPGQQTADDRRKGMNDYLTKYPNIEVASQTAHWRRLEGMQVTENTLQRWPDLNAVIGASGEMVLGAVEAVKSANIPNDKIVLGGVDVYPDIVKALKAGDIDFTISQAPQKQAYWSVAAMIKFLNGEKVPKEIRTPTAIVTAANADEYVEQ
ncbi:MAG: D-ribose-binding periplasmic protein precursor [Chloroflexi bacterium ADurb.Bin180]|nr:MAG: D-ribose-binding periplasmic protein precursor [Chloroflexi bacterium ADurb.Bin180]HOU22997.1 sugar ABC transporter substrate-binding protein [Anaerolineae bacterium]HQJ52322.1 sugar ABC transporter substrate-binding protein [Anaerolineae bacterium]